MTPSSVRSPRWRRNGKVKVQLTGAKTSIDKAYDLVESMAARVRAQLQELDVLVRPAGEEAVQRPDEPASGVDQLAL